MPKTKKQVSKDTPKKLSAKKSAKKPQKKEKSKSYKSESKSKQSIKPCEWIYMDNVSSSTLCPKAEKAYKSNISSISIPSDKKKIVDDAKDYIIKCCGTVEEDYSVYFTSCEIESNRLILCCAVHAYRKIRKTKPHIVISSVEHGSILTYANSLNDSGQIELTIIKPNSYGCILSGTIADALKPNTCLVLITYINHELGSVNNIEKISGILHEKKIPLHSNCTHLFGKHNLNLKKTGIDAITIAFNKINGPVGLGALIINNNFFTGYKLNEHSTTLENKSPDNIPAILASMEALKFSLSNRQSKNKKILKFRNEIIDKLGAKCQTMTFANFMKSDAPPLEETEKSKNKLVILGPPVDNTSYYTPGILSLVIIGSKKKTGEIIKKDLEKKGIVVGLPDLSRNNMYDEIGMPEEAQKYIIRISLSDDITQANVTKFITSLKGVI